MFEYTENNHYKFGFIETDFFVNRTSKDHSWIVKHGKCSYSPGTWKDECLITAEKIYNSTDLPINIMFSGGIDSEVVVRNFLELGVSFKVSILQYKNNLNLHDIAYAVVFCDQHNIKYDIIELDIVNFLENDAYDYAAKTQCCHPHYCPGMWLADQIDGLPVIGGGGSYLTKRLPNDYVPGVSPYEFSLWDLWGEEMTASMYTHFINQNRPAVPAFYQYTPEITYSYLIDEIIQQLINNKRHGKLSTSTTKFDIFSKHYTDLLYRKKYHGFEKIKEISAIHESNLKTTYKDCLGNFKFEVNELIEYMKYV